MIIPEVSNHVYNGFKLSVEVSRLASTVHLKYFAKGCSEVLIGVLSVLNIEGFELSGFNLFIHCLLNSVFETNSDSS